MPMGFRVPGLWCRLPSPSPPHPFSRARTAQAVVRAHLERGEESPEPPPFLSEWWHVLMTTDIASLNRTGYPRTLKSNPHDNSSSGVATACLRARTPCEAMAVFSWEPSLWHEL